MSLKRKLQARLKALNSHDAVVHHKKIGGRVRDATLAKVEEEAQVRLPEEMTAFYREMNGVELSWSLNADEGTIFGSISILSLQRAMFGDVGVISRDRYENAFEDMLWNDFYSSAKIKALKKHRVLESVEGEPTFVTFRMMERKAQLFLVEEETIKSIQVPFGEYLDLLFEGLGAGRLREHLTSKQWEQKIRKDPELQYMARL